MRKEPTRDACLATPLARSRALSIGFTDRVLQAARFERVLFGVHQLVDQSGSSDRERVRRLLLATMQVRPDASASCLAAALMWNLPMPSRRLDRVHVRAAAQMRRPQLVAHRGECSSIHLVDGVRVTSAAQTFIDLAAELDDSWLLVIADAMAQRRLVTIDELKAAVRANVERPGIRRARRVVELVRVGSESPMESLLRLAIIAHGLAEPIVNGPAYDLDSGWLARVDLSYPDHRIAIEYQGDQHRTDVHQWRSDITRTRALQTAGWTVILATADDITAPDGLVTTIREALRKAASGRDEVRD